MSERGFTIAELLVALLVFAALSAAGVVVLRMSVDARERLTVMDAELAALENARTLMKDDFAQVALRTVRDEFGAPVPAPFVGGDFIQQDLAREEERRLVAFVRRGWLNPEWRAPRPQLQYVEYLLIDGNLVRRTRAYLDDARDQPVNDRILIENVGEATFAFLNGIDRGELQWATAWPVSGGGVSAPQAVSLSVSTRRYGAIEQFFWIGDVAAGGRVGA